MGAVCFNLHDLHQLSDWCRLLCTNWDRICRLVLETGNIGHNIDQTYRTKYPGLVAKAITFSGGWVNMRG